MIYDVMRAILIWLMRIDDSMLLFVNGIHNPFFDGVMWLISARWTWLPFYFFLVWLLFRYTTRKRALLCLLAIGILIAASDQTCATLIRPEFERLRPANLANPISAFVHTVNGYRGGSYGFPSCHAANTFALAAFLSLQLKRRWVCVMMFVWAMVVSYSRMYLGVHYLGDILCGAVVGSFYAVVLHFLLKYAYRRFDL